MTVKEMIKALQDLGEDCLDKGILMFDGPACYTPCRIEILDDTWKDKAGHVLID